MAESDWDGWRALTERLGKKVQLVGDDVFVTNAKILREGIQLGIANSILIKVNQIGTLTETFAAIELAEALGLYRGDLAPLGRDRGHHHRGHRRRHERAADQDRVAVRARTAWPSTTSCCASRKIWARRSAIRGAKPSIS